MTQTKLTIEQGILLLSAIVVSIGFRLFPSIAHFNPQIVFVLFFGTIFSKPLALFSVGMMTVLSDVVSAKVWGYPAFGSWTFFTYSAFLGIALSPYILNISAKGGKFILGAVTSGLGFWLWTNFGTWWFSGLYPHNDIGLGQCYVLALPFLMNTTLAAMLWSGSLVVAGHLSRRMGKVSVASVPTQ